MTRNGLIANLPAPHRDRLLAVGHETQFAPHTRIFEEGEAATRFWLLRSGAVNLDLHVPGHRDAVVETLGPGDLLGWAWLIPPYRWHLGAESQGHVRALEFDAATVRAMGHEHPDFGHTLDLACIRIVADRLHATRLRLLQLYGPHGVSAPERSVR